MSKDNDHFLNETSSNIDEISRDGFVDQYNWVALEDLQLPDFPESSTISDSGQELKLSWNVKISM